jgi:chromosome segregation ATPase
MSPRDNKTDDSKYETSTEKDRVLELEAELQLLRDTNEYLKNENTSLRAILKDYEETKTNEDLLLEKLETAVGKEEELENKITELINQNTHYEARFKKMHAEVQALRKENSKLTTTAEMNTNHLDTKVRLLKEALNKRNEDITELEGSNEELIKLLEKCDQKLLKLDEDYKLEKIKCEKYEQQLHLNDPDFQKIDIDTIDGRISFMVNILEEYRKMLEEDSQFESEGRLSNI